MGSVLPDGWQTVCSKGHTTDHSSKCTHWICPQGRRYKEWTDVQAYFQLLHFEDDIPGVECRPENAKKFVEPAEEEEVTLEEATKKEMDAKANKAKGTKTKENKRKRQVAEEEESSESEEELEAKKKGKKNDNNDDDYQPEVNPTSSAVDDSTKKSPKRTRRSVAVAAAKEVKENSKCTQCKSVFLSDQDLQKHVKSVHKGKGSLAKPTLEETSEVQRKSEQQVGNTNKKQDPVKKQPVAELGNISKKPSVSVGGKSQQTKAVVDSEVIDLDSPVKDEKIKTTSASKSVSIVKIDDVQEVKSSNSQVGSKDDLKSSTQKLYDTRFELFKEFCSKAGKGLDPMKAPPSMLDKFLQQIQKEKNLGKSVLSGYKSAILKIQAEHKSQPEGSESKKPTAPPPTSSKPPPISKPVATRATITPVDSKPSTPQAAKSVLVPAAQSPSTPVQQQVTRQQSSQGRAAAAAGSQQQQKQPTQPHQIKVNTPQTKQPAAINTPQSQKQAATPQSQKQVATPSQKQVTTPQSQKQLTTPQSQKQTVTPQSQTRGGVVQQNVRQQTPQSTRQTPRQQTPQSTTRQAPQASIRQTTPQSGPRQQAVQQQQVRQAVQSGQPRAQGPRAQTQQPATPRQQSPQVRGIQPSSQQRQATPQPRQQTPQTRQQRPQNTPQQQPNQVRQQLAKNTSAPQPQPKYSELPTFLKSLVNFPCKLETNAGGGASLYRAAAQHAGAGQEGWQDLRRYCHGKLLEWWQWYQPYYTFPLQVKLRMRNQTIQKTVPSSAEFQKFLKSEESLYSFHMSECELYCLANILGVPIYQLTYNLVGVGGKPEERCRWDTLDPHHGLIHQNKFNSNKEPLYILYEDKVHFCKIVQTK